MYSCVIPKSVNLVGGRTLGVRSPWRWKMYAPSTFSALARFARTTHTKSVGRRVMMLRFIDACGKLLAAADQKDYLRI